MLTGASSLDRGIEGEQVGLLRKIIDYLDNFSDIVGALAELSNDLRGSLDRRVDAVQTVGGFVHRLNATVNLFT